MTFVVQELWLLQKRATIKTSETAAHSPDYERWHRKLRNKSRPATVFQELCEKKSF